MGIKSNITLLSNVAAAGNGAAQTVSVGGSYMYQMAGTFGGTSGKLQMLGPDGTTFVDIPGTTLAASGMAKIDIPAGMQVRAVLTGGTPSAMYSSLGLVQGAS